jgi:hypothetical protein
MYTTNKVASHQPEKQQSNKVKKKKEIKLQQFDKLTDYKFRQKFYLSY